MERKLVLAARKALPERIRPALFLCASLSPACAGLPHLMEYVWIYMTTLRQPTSQFTFPMATLNEACAAGG